MGIQTGVRRRRYKWGKRSNRVVCPSRWYFLLRTQSERNPPRGVFQRSSLLGTFESVMEGQPEAKGGGTPEPPATNGASGYGPSFTLVVPHDDRSTMIVALRRS
jgi:hypothetical protein